MDVWSMRRLPDNGGHCRGLSWSEVLEQALYNDRKFGVKIGHRGGRFREFKLPMDENLLWQAQR